MGEKKIYNSPVGRLLVEVENGFLVRLDFADGIQAEGKNGNESALLAKVAMQLDEYFRGARKNFDLPLNPAGTEFQRKVWDALLAIPYGETRTYREIAEAAGCPRGFRAVGMANNKNPIAIIIPCHRVIGSNGKLVGYAGGLGRKEALLALEAGQIGAF